MRPFALEPTLACRLVPPIVLHFSLSGSVSSTCSLWKIMWESLQKERRKCNPCHLITPAQEWHLNSMPVAGWWMFPWHPISCSLFYLQISVQCSSLNISAMLALQVLGFWFWYSSFEKKLDINVSLLRDPLSLCIICNLHKAYFIWVISSARKTMSITKRYLSLLKRKKWYEVYNLCRTKYPNDQSGSQVHDYWYVKLQALIKLTRICNINHFLKFCSVACLPWL